MTHLPPVIAIDGASSAAQLLEAAAIIERCDGSVVFAGLVSLSASPKEIRCEVIDPSPGAHRCAEEFAVLKENAARALEGSAFARMLPARPRRWVAPAG